MNITITFGTDDKNFSVWSNNDIQKIFALYNLLSSVKEFNLIRIVNLGIDIKTIKSEVGFGINNIKFHTWDNIKNNTDLLIESSAKLNKRQSGYLKRRNCKIVSYIVNNPYLSDLQDVTFNSLKTQIVNNDYDEIWIYPHHQKLNENYLKELYNTPVYTLPYIWTDIFIKEYEEFLYETEQVLKCKIHNAPKNIIILEQNSDISNSSIYPMLIINQVYKKFPSLINKIRVLNTSHLHKNSKYLSVVNNLNIFKEKKITFEHSHPTPFILSTVADIVISHQWENELNNLYFDTFYGEYPLLHNSETLKGYGFYYDKFNIDEASKKLISILKNYHLMKDNYINSCSQAMYIYSPNNQANINRYKERILDLMK